MRIHQDHILAKTVVLRDETRAAEVIKAMNGPLHAAELDGLRELIARDVSAKTGVAAVRKLVANFDDLTIDALHDALCSQHASVRLAALRALANRAATCQYEIARFVREDASWMVRREAVAALGSAEEPHCWAMLAAADDPHWRVRHALAETLLARFADARQQSMVDELLLQRADVDAVHGLQVYLNYRHSRREPTEFPAPVDPRSWCPFWDWDAAVLAQRLESMGRQGRSGSLEIMPRLAGHDDERVRRWALASIGSDGDISHLVQLVALLDEPRRPAVPSVRGFLSRLDLDRTAATVRSIFALPQPFPTQLSWAISASIVALPRPEVEAFAHALVERGKRLAAPPRCALVRLVMALADDQLDDWLVNSLADTSDAEVQTALLEAVWRRKLALPAQSLVRFAGAADASVRTAVVPLAVRENETSLVQRLARDEAVAVRVAVAKLLCGSVQSGARSLITSLQADANSHVRAAALTPERAAALLAAPMQETSWLVLERAALVCKTPLWHLEPEQPWRAVTPLDSPPPTLAIHAGSSRLVTLGPAQLKIAPLGVSGHYSLPAAGFARAMEAGVNLMFWEPGYHTLNEFAARITPRDRREIRFLSGTFQADALNIRRDVERCLRQLQIERLDLFLIFWVQSWARITDELRRELDDLQAGGKITMFGLSTHVRPLAIEAMRSGWNPVMVRHSAAHRGAEREVFPAAIDTKTTLITFNNTCYGRLLRRLPVSPTEPPSASDCYRYSLAQLGVTACLTAPSTLEQLEENLTALSDPAISEQRMAELRVHGDAVYREDEIFRKLVCAL